MNQKYKQDIDSILSTIRCNGGEYWSTPDGGVAKGVPFSTLEVAMMLREIGYDDAYGELEKIAELVFANIRGDGRIKVYSSGAIYPCQTANAARALCYLGYAKDPRLKQTFEWFLDNQHFDGGWRCNASKFGRGPETEFSNPGPTLTVLDAFRFTDHLNNSEQLDKAVEFLLRHWETRAPLGPCHYGIGTLFMKLEYPMVRYNIFHYAYTLSFYDAAKKDRRFLEALDVIAKKLIDGKIVVESTNKKLSNFEFCKIMTPSEVATARYHEILKNLQKKA